MLKGKVALITGGSRGIGRAVALSMAREGADIALVYASSEEAAQQTQREIEAMGVCARCYRCDVSSFEETLRTTEQVLKDFGGVDILVNNAGITRDGLIFQMKEEDFDRVIDTNLKGAFHMIKHLYRNFIRKRAGRIINIASVAGLMGNAGQANYAAAKAGMIGLAKTTAKELAGRGITCNVVAPGFVATDMTGKLPEQVLSAAQEAIPLKRMGSPEEIAAACTFLASDGAGYITGAVIPVDGGLNM